MPEKKNTIGRFEIIEKIGEGPIGAVYKALDPVIRRTVAIKVIKLYALEETSTFAEVFEKIYRVVRTSTSLNHPNICIIYDLSEEKKIPYITMEFVEGHDLESLLRQKHQFKRPELLNILQQTCDALDFAHKKNVVHQDLKSTNILVTPDLHVKITDFGIAGLDEIAAAQTKKLLSIPYYISPEQALGEKVTPASDLFSLGVVIYQLLSGQLPFPGTTAANAIMMIARDNPSVPVDLNRSAISRDDWNSFFSIALAKSTNQRFRSAREMIEALNSILPASDQTYYPFGFETSATDSTGKFEKTYIADSGVDTASPTVMIDASKVMVEAAAMEASAQMEEGAHPILDAGTNEIGLGDQHETGAVQEPHAETELHTSLDEGLQESEKAAITQEPTPVSTFPSVPKTQMLELPFSPEIEEPSHQVEPAYKTVPPAIEPSLPADFIPAVGNIFDLDEEEQDEVLATLAPAPAKAEAASDTSPVNLAPPAEAKPVVDSTPPKIQFTPLPPAPPPPEPEMNLNAPTQMLQVPKLDQSSGNGKGEPSVVEAAATVMAIMTQPEPPPQASTLLVTPQAPPQPEPPSSESYKPTKIITEMPPAQPPVPPPSQKIAAPVAAAQQITEPIPAKPKPPEPAPKAVPYQTVRPVETKPAGKPPAMQKYFYAAIAVFIFIALVGGGILFFRKPSQEPVPVEPKPATPQTTQQQQPKPGPTPVQPAPQPASTTGSVMVTSEPAGATVLIGDQDRGVTPVEIPELAFGKYTLTLKLKGYQDSQKDVELTADNPNVTLPITLDKVAVVTGTLTVTSQPDGALIVIANKVLGTTPKTLTRKPGSYQITLKKDGYQDYTGTVQIVQDKKATFQGTLAEIPKPAPVVETPKPKEPEVTRGQLVTLGPDVIPPKPKNKVYAKYPDTAKNKKLEGTVRVNLLVDETGKVIDIKVMKSAHPILDDAVVKAYQQWTFEPATKQGVPVKVWISVSMSFQSGRS